MVDKMSITLLCILLIGHHVHAVVNKASSTSSASSSSSGKEEEKQNEIKADDRISNSYGPPSNDFGSPLGAGFNGPAPVYGPPELVGDHGPTAVFPPPPPELPPPVFGPPVSSFGPPRNVKPHGPPKQSFGLSLTSLPSKLNFGPTKLHFGPPKQHFGPPLASISSFRPPKPQYGPPLKLNVAPLNQFGSSSGNHHGPPKLGHGPPIPISLETYGPPPPKIAIQFNSVGKDEYGPPPPPHPVSQPQFGPPGGDLYGPPPPGPPPGVPAPPTPPDIKYDGWQPIAGLTSQHGQPSGSYGPPSGGNFNFDVNSHGSHGSHGSSGSHGHHGGSNSVSENSNVPSDSYGVPIHNPEAQDLKTSVHESSSSSESNGLPPPPLPQYEPLHNDNQNHQSGKEEHEKYVGSQHSGNLQFEVPKVEPLSIVKTVGFELLPTPGSLTSNIQGLSLSEGGHGLSTLNHGSSFNINSGPSISTLQLGSIENTHDLSLGSGDSQSFHGVGNDLSVQQLSIHGPSNGYGPPLSIGSFEKINSISSGISLPPPPPVFDTYSAPPASSYSPNGPYPAAQAGRASSSLSFHGSFHKHGPHHHRPHGLFRSPPQPLGSLIPPRNREPIKFREPIPSGLLSNLHRYLPSLRPIDLTKPPKSFVSPISLGQQLPSFGPPVSFHQSSGGSAFSSSFSNSFGKTHHLNSAMAAPNVQYGTPLSFVDFNTPAPILTYGAPNFGPATSFGSTSNGFGGSLYDGVSNTVATYGTPVVNAQLSTGIGHDCGFQQSSGESGAQFSAEDTGSHESHESHGPNLETSSSPPSQPPGQPTAVDIDQNSLFKVAVEAVSNNLAGGLQITPSVNHLDLQNYEQQKVDLKDSYGNPIGITYDTSDHANALSNDRDHSSSNGVTSVLPISSSGQHHFSGNTQFHEGGISAEALTASLTMQGFGQGKSLGSNEVDASQFLKTDEGSEALSLAQGLTADGHDGFQIQGSKGTYMLQIQAADGGLGTENSDGSIRHDQVLSNGLLQDILAAIEQPDQGHIQLQGLPQAQPLEEVFNGATKVTDISRISNIPRGHFITIDSGLQKKDVDALIASASDRNGENDNGEAGGAKKVALFFNNQYADSRKETRSVTKNEGQNSADSQKSKTKSS